jgi:hypothetical protein
MHDIFPHLGSGYGMVGFGYAIFLDTLQDEEEVCSKVK